MIRNLPLIATALASAACTVEQDSDTPPPVDVTLQQLIADYEENQVAAELRYAASGVRLTVGVRSIKGSVEEPLLNLEWDETLLPVQAKLADGYKHIAVDIRPGDEVTLICPRVSDVMGTPMLGDCQAVRKNPPTSIDPTPRPQPE
jgi:hypothetical protein